MKRVTSDLADSVTLHRAEALIEFADATPDDDTPESLLDATLAKVARALRGRSVDG